MFVLDRTVHGLSFCGGMTLDNDGMTGLYMYKWKRHAKTILLLVVVVGVVVLQFQRWLTYVMPKFYVGLDGFSGVLYTSTVLVQLNKFI